MPQDNAVWVQFQDDFAAWGITEPRVVIHGGYGKHNLGDDAILEAILLRLGSLWPQARISVLCHDPRPVCSAHPSVRAYSFKDPRVLRVISAADLYIIGGGGIVNRINTYSGFATLKALDLKGKFLFMAGWLSKLCGAGLIFYSVGTTSVPDSVVAWLAREVIKSADSVSVRDPLSKTVLRQIGVQREVAIIPDPATALRPVASEWAMDVLRCIGIDLNRLLVGLCMRYTRDPDINNSDVLLEAARVVEWLVEDQKAQVLFLPFGRHPRKTVENDFVFAQELHSRLGIDRDFWILEQEYRPSEMMAIMAQIDVGILERLHACILATTVHTPTLAIAYDAKVSEFMKLSRQGNRYILLRDFTLERVQSKWQELQKERLVRKP